MVLIIGGKVLPKSFVIFIFLKEKGLLLYSYCVCVVYWWMQNNMVLQCDIHILV